ncbi:MAG: putative integrase [Chlorobi bacterium]|nr:putative integrase [Chlorobiota bacterium]
MAIERKRVERLMRENRIVGLMPKRRRVVTTDSRHGHPITDNVLDQDFTAASANRKWVNDITYIATSEGWLYLASVIDLFSRRGVGWSMSDRVDQHLTLNALRMAVERRQPADGLLHHSDRGSQYCTTAYQQMLADWRMIPSMSRKGNCWNNAVIKSWHRTLKVEVVYRQRYRSRSEARASTRHWGISAPTNLDVSTLLTRNSPLYKSGGTSEDHYVAAVIGASWACRGDAGSSERGSCRGIPTVSGAICQGVADGGSDTVGGVDQQAVSDLVAASAESLN